ncbi:MAG: hypothetical protein KBT01_06460 [Clostridiales bacterium]|nr:hypothetical protein [Candidatus Blautia equi]
MKKHIPAAVLSAVLITNISAGALMVQADPQYSIGVVQMDDMDFFNDLTFGFEDAVMESLGSDAVMFDEISAQGDPANLAGVMQEFLSQQDDLIFVSSDLMLSAAMAATDSMPIIGASVFYSGSAGNVAGITALAPYSSQADMIRAMLPDVTSVGIVFAEGNASSEAQASGMTTALTNVGLTCTNYTFTDDITSALTTAADENQVIYLPADSSLEAYGSTISSLSLEKMTPVITADEALCSACGLATVSAAPYDMGYEAGKLAADALTGMDISSMGIKTAPILLNKYNEKMTAAFSLMIPEDFESIEDFVLESGNDGIEEMTDEQIAQLEAEMASND